MRLKKSRVDLFVKKIRGKQVYCFGAGKELKRFLNEFCEYHIESKIKSIVDNCQEKCGLITIHDVTVPIIHTNQMLYEIKSGDVILITTAFFVEIAEQLAGYDQLDDVEVYVYSQLWEDQCDYERQRIPVPQKLYTKEEITIPKKIHYCWFGKQDIPVQSRIWMESWKKFCPDYEIIEWNESNYDIGKNLYIRQAYEKQKWAFVSDYVRLDVIEQFGGVYLDTDVELLRKIDDLLKNNAFCGFEQKKYVNFGLGYGAVKHHKLVKRLRDDYEERYFILPDGSLNEKTCTQYQTELLLEHGLEPNGRYQEVEDIVVYPELVLCGMSPHSFRIAKCLHDTYAIHHYAASWHGQEFHDKKQIRRKFYDGMELA